MAVATVARTLGDLVLAVVELSGHYRNQGTYTAGTTTTGTDATNERTPVAEANLITSTSLYKRAGTGAGEASEITSYGTVGVFTWNTANTAPDTTTTWIRAAVRFQRVLDAIAAVTREAAKLQAQTYDTLALVTGNLLGPHGDFENWPSGTTSVPEAWGTLVTSTVAQLTGASSVTPRQGLYAVAVTDDGSTGGYMPFIIPPSLYTRLESQTLYMRGFLSQSAASVGRLRLIATDEAGTATGKNWDADQTGNRWVDLQDVTDGTAGFALPSTINDLQLRLTALLASGVVRADGLILYGPRLHDYDLPEVMIGLETDIGMESGYRTGDFSAITLEYGTDWTLIQRDGTARRTIHFYEAPDNLRRLRIKGFRAPDVVTSATANVEPNPEWLALAAAVRLLKTHPEGGNREMLPFLQADLAKMERSPVGNTMKGKSYVWVEPR